MNPGGNRARRRSSTTVLATESAVGLSDRRFSCAATFARPRVHEMMHTLGYGESPQIPGFPSSAQITEAVANACGRT
jgi:hypothetical protein